MPAIDSFVGSMSTDYPATSALTVVPNDNVDLVQVPRALWVGVTGDLSVVMKDGQTVTFPSVAVGWMPLRVTRVRATGTTAASIVAVW